MEHALDCADTCTEYKEDAEYEWLEYVPVLSTNDCKSGRWRDVHVSYSRESDVVFVDAPVAAACHQRLQGQGPQSDQRGNCETILGSSAFPRNRSCAVADIAVLGNPIAP